MKATKPIKSILTSVFIFLGLVIFAQDPVQYGTPFSGVPDPRDVSIYQVNIRLFSPTHNLAGVTARLDNIKALGVNVIYLMPIQPVGTDSKAVNSPYCMKDYKAIGAEFGTLEDLRALVDGAHARGMAVMLDWIANHTSFDHVWTANKSWYKLDKDGNIASTDAFKDVAQLNFDNKDMVNAMIDALRYWVFAANVDGFRCDYANNPPISFWTEVISNLRKIKTHKLIMMAEGDRTANYTAGFDYIFGDVFYYESVKPIYKNNASVDTTIAKSNFKEYKGASDSNAAVRYLSNHDVYNNEGSPYNLLGGRAAVMSAFMVSAYMKGIPFIYNGMEVGETIDLKWPFVGIHINWNQNPDIAEEYAKIINFRNISNAIRRGILTDYSNKDVCAFTKISGNERVLVITNLRNSNVNYTIPKAFTNTSWNEVFTSESVNVGVSISLPAYTYKIYRATN